MQELVQMLSVDLTLPARLAGARLATLPRIGSSAMGNQRAGGLSVRGLRLSVTRRVGVHTEGNPVDWVSASA